MKIPSIQTNMTNNDSEQLKPNEIITIENTHPKYRGRRHYSHHYHQHHQHHQRKRHSSHKGIRNYKTNNSKQHKHDNQDSTSLNNNNNSIGNNDGSEVAAVHRLRSHSHSARISVTLALGEEESASCNHKSSQTIDKDKSKNDENKQNSNHLEFKQQTTPEKKDSVIIKNTQFSNTETRQRSRSDASSIQRFRPRNINTNNDNDNDNDADTDIDVNDEKDHSVNRTRNRKRTKSVTRRSKSANRNKHGNKKRSRNSDNVVKTGKTNTKMKSEKKSGSDIVASVYSLKRTGSASISKSRERDQKQKEQHARSRSRSRSRSRGARRHSNGDESGHRRQRSFSMSVSRLHILQKQSSQKQSNVNRRSVTPSYRSRSPSHSNNNNNNGSKGVFTHYYNKSNLNQSGNNGNGGSKRNSNTNGKDKNKDKGKDKNKDKSNNLTDVRIANDMDTSNLSVAPSENKNQCGRESPGVVTPNGTRHRSVSTVSIKRKTYLNIALKVTNLVLIDMISVMVVTIMHILIHFETLFVIMDAIVTCMIVYFSFKFANGLYDKICIWRHFTDMCLIYCCFDLFFISKCPSFWETNCLRIKSNNDSKNSNSTHNNQNQNRNQNQSQTNVNNPENYHNHNHSHDGDRNKNTNKNGNNNRNNMHNGKHNIHKSGSNISVDMTDAAHRPAKVISPKDSKHNTENLTQMQTQIEMHRSNQFSIIQTRSRSHSQTQTQTQITSHRHAGDHDHDHDTHYLDPGMMSDSECDTDNERSKSRTGYMNNIVMKRGGHGGHTVADSVSHMSLIDRISERNEHNYSYDINNMQNGSIVVNSIDMLKKQSTLAIGGASLSVSEFQGKDQTNHDDDRHVDSDKELDSKKMLQARLRLTLKSISTSRGSDDIDHDNRLNRETQNNTSDNNINDVALVDDKMVAHVDDSKSCEI